MRVSRIAYFSGVALVLLASSVSAQTGGASNRAAAEALFNEGRKLAASGKYADACPKFEASEQLDPGLGTLLNLAECYEKIGKTASAWAEYREAIPLARASGSKVRQDLATERAAALESRLSMLTIRAMGGSEEASGLEIRRDGVPVQPAELGSPIPVDPGPHTIEAAAPGKQKWSSTVQVTDAARLAVEVPALTPLATSAAPPTQAPKPVEAPPLDQGVHSRSASTHSHSWTTAHRSASSFAHKFRRCAFSMRTTSSHGARSNGCLRFPRRGSPMSRDRAIRFLTNGVEPEET